MGNKALTRVSPLLQNYTPPRHAELSHELAQLTQRYGWISLILASTIRCWSLDIVGLVSSYAAGLRPLLVPAHMPMPIPFPQRIVQTFCDFESGDVAIVCRSNERLERLMFEPKRLASNYAYINKKRTRVHHTTGHGLITRIFQVMHVSFSAAISSFAMSI